MAPSRGIKTQDADEVAVSQQSNSALANARRNFNYLIRPDKSLTSNDKPARLRTRALLRTVRYISQFIIWRLVRWAKYAAIGFAVATVSATALGSVISGTAWILAPTSFGASIIAASVWGFGKFAARRLHKRWETTGGDQGEAQREYTSDHPDRQSIYGVEMGPRAVPW